MNKKRIKVLQVISNFGVGGAETWLIALLRYFKEHVDELGVAVETDVFLTNGVRDRLDDEAESLGARLIYARYGRDALPSFIAAWRRTLACGRYDAVHDHQEFTAGWHFLFGRGVLPPVRIAHLHNAMSHQESYARSWFRSQTIALGNRLVARHATHLLSTSRQLIAEQGFDDLKAARDLPRKALYCGFDTSRFIGNRSEAKARLLRELSWPENSRIMLFVGRLDSHPDPAKNEKNPVFCLNVAKLCAERDPHFRCLIAGGGEAVLEELRNRVAAWGLSDRIVFLGARKDVPQLMLGADLLLFPSIAEGLGMVAVEAQAAGLCVLASDAVPKECCVVDGMVEFKPLADGEAAWSAAVMDRLARPPVDPLWANHQVSTSPFSIENSARALVQIYQGYDCQ